CRGCARPVPAAGANEIRGWAGGGLLPGSGRRTKRATHSRRSGRAALVRRQRVGRRPGLVLAALHGTKGGRCRPGGGAGIRKKPGKMIDTILGPCYDLLPV